MNWSVRPGEGMIFRLFPLVVSFYMLAGTSAVSAKLVWTGLGLGWLGLAICMWRRPVIGPGFAMAQGILGVATLVGHYTLFHHPVSWLAGYFAVLHAVLHFLGLALRNALAED